jgi:hypothetical protein
MRGEQYMENIRSGGKVQQRTSLPATQVMRDIDAAGDVQQIIEVLSTNLDVIAAQLADLIPKIVDYDPNATGEVERLTRAEAAAQSGNASEMLAALKGIGRWVIDFSSKVGAGVVAKLIEKQMGI